MRCLLLLLAACGGSNAPTCPGAPATTVLSEGYCTANEADRCYFHPKPADGF